MGMSGKEQTAHKKVTDELAKGLEDLAAAAEERFAASDERFTLGEATFVELRGNVSELVRGLTDETVARGDADDALRQEFAKALGALRDRGLIGRLKWLVVGR